MRNDAQKIWDIGVRKVMEERKRTLQSTIPRLFDGTRKSVLYIGACARRHMFLKKFEKTYGKVYLLEIWKPYLEELKKIVKPETTIIIGDVRKVDEIEELPNVDVSFFWHGMEHLDFYDFGMTIRKMESKTKHLVIFGNPWGQYKPRNKDVKENPYESHKSALYPLDFERLGYNTKTIGRPDSTGTSIIAWKYIEDEK
jgi:hypothetical protein